MDIKNLKKNWDEFGKTDPLWAILTALDKKDNKWEIDKFFKTGTEEIREVMNYIGDKGFNRAPKRALDFGCGVGRLSQALGNYFEEIYGVDIAPSMIELAKKYNKLGEKCKYVLNLSDDLQLFDNESFDFIYTNITLQHMKPKYIKNYLREFLRILARNGYLVFQLPSERIRSANLFKRILRYLIPEEFLDFLFHSRIRLQSFFDKKPLMEMYSIKRETMITFLNEEGVKILDIKEEINNSSVWVSSRYCVTKL